MNNYNSGKGFSLDIPYSLSYYHTFPKHNHLLPIINFFKNKQA